MFSVEKKALQFVEKNVYIALLVVSTIISFLIRFAARDFASGDFFYHLSHWYDEISNAGGFAALRNQVGDYNILYQIIISVFTYTKIPPLYAYKIISVVFDYSLAVGAGFLVCILTSDRFVIKTFTITYSVVILLPTVIFNSSFWAQCDSIFTFFIVLALLCIRKEKDILAFVFLGISCAFKLQFIFIIPFFILLYLCYKRFSIVHFLIIPAVCFLTSLPAVFMGRSWKVFFDIYFSQTNEYPLMNVNIPNAYALISGDMYPYLKNFAILITVAFLMAGMVFFLVNKTGIKDGELFVACATWMIWTCIMFLPSMHERYIYPMEITLAILTVMNFKKYFIPFFILEIISFRMYALFLFNSSAVEAILPILFLSVYGYFTYRLIIDFKNAAVKTEL